MSCFVQEMAVTKTSTDDHDDVSEVFRGTEKVITKETLFSRHLFTAKL